MGHSFEKPTESHQIHEIGHPQGHGHMDQKLHKGMRSPMAGRLPSDAGLESPENAPGLEGPQNGGSGSY